MPAAAAELVAAAAPGLPVAPLSLRIDGEWWFDAQARKLTGGAAHLPSGESTGASSAMHTK